MKHLVFMVVATLAFQFAWADLSIVAIGDTGKGNEGQYQVGKAMAKTCRQMQCQLALLLGDNIYDVGISSPQDNQMVEKFEKPYAEMPAPFYVALGNHDYGKLANEWVKGDHQVAYSKTNPNYILPSHYYSFVKEDVLFIVLDTSRLFHDKDTELQRTFVREALAKNKKKWIVAVAHHPYISNGKHGNAGNYDGVPFPPYSGSVIKKFVEKELCPHIDLFVSGHDHNLQTLPGQGACASVLFVVSGTGASGDSKLGSKNPTLFQSPALGFTSLKFKADHVVVSHINVEGDVLHSHNHRKKASSFDFIPWFD